MKYLHILLYIPIVSGICFYIFLLLSDNLNEYVLTALLVVIFISLMYIAFKIQSVRVALFTFILSFIVVIFILGAVSDESTRSSKPGVLKANMNSVRSYGDIYYQINDRSYVGVCNSSEFLKIKEIINNLYTGSDQVFETKFTCNDSITNFAAQAFEKEQSKYYCVDSSGFYGFINDSIQSITNCPK